MNKPKFDPSKPFEAVKPKFDPSQPFEAVPEPTSGGKTFLQDRADDLTAFGNQVTDFVSGDHTAQLQSLVEGLLPNPTEETDEDLKEKGFVLPTEKNFAERRDEFKKNNEILQEENPLMTAAGTGVGLATAALPMSAASKAVSAGSTLARYGTAAATGAAQGAFQNPGDIEGEIAGPQLDERLKNAGIGAALGIGAQGLGEGISKAVDRVTTGAKSASEGATMKAAGAMKRDLDNLADSGKMADLTDFALKQKHTFKNTSGKDVVESLVTPGDSVKDVLRKTTSLTDKYGKKIGEIYKSTTEKLKDPDFLATLNPAKKAELDFAKVGGPGFADEIVETISNQYVGQSGRPQVLRAVGNALEELRSMGDDIPIDQLHKYRQSIDTKIKWDGANQQEVQEALKTVRNMINSRIQEKIDILDNVLGGSNLSELKQANQVFSKAITLREMAQDGVNRGANNAFIGLLEGAAAATGATVGSLPGMAASALAMKAARTFGSGILAHGADKVSQLPKMLPTIQSNPGVLSGFAGIAGAKNQDLTPENTPPELIQEQIITLGEFPNFNRIDRLSLPRQVKDSLKESAVNNLRSQAVDGKLTVPPEKTQYFSKTIQDSDSLSNIEKARLLNGLNRTGEVELDSYLKHVIGAKGMPKPQVDRRPTSPEEMFPNEANRLKSPKDLSDFVGKKKPEAY